MMDPSSLIESGLALAGRNSSVTITVTLLCFITLSAYQYYSIKYSYWRRKGIDGPRPWPVFGNLIQFIFANRMQQAMDWMRAHGKVYGIYFGVRPQLCVADPEVMIQLCVKDFDVAPNHEVNELFNIYQKKFLFFAQDDHWRKMRALMSPTFTSGKIKRMFKLLDTCANDLVECGREQIIEAAKNGKPAVLNMKDLYNLYTMDAITTCCYGMKLERVGTTNIKAAASRNEFVRIAMKIFEFSVIRFIIAFAVPKKILKAIGFSVSNISRFRDLEGITKKTIELRKNSKDKKFDDYLQLLIDTRIDNELELTELDKSENHHAGLTHESLIEDQRKMVAQVKSSDLTNGEKSVQSKFELSEIEILSSAMFLLIVGVETTGTLLTSTAYTLAFHSEVQERLHEEMEAIAEFNENKQSYVFDYDKLTTCKYLDAVISESLRFMPPVTQIDRFTSQEYRIEKYNIDLPKGSKIFISYHAIMNDPDYWHEPEKFNPDRFMPENRNKIVPGSYCPFGIGPRHCIGMRFSLTEAKLALAKMVMNYKFEPAPGTVFPPEPKTNLGLNGIKNPVVQLVPRK